MKTEEFKKAVISELKSISARVEALEKLDKQYYVEKSERILLYNRFGQKNDVERRLKDVIHFANKAVIPICKALGMPLLKPAILKYVADDEVFMGDYVNMRRGDFSIDEAKKEFAVQKSLYPYPVFPGCRQLTADEEKLITFDGEAMSYSVEKLTEYTNVYLTDKRGIEGYRRAEELCGFLNEFFSGTQLAPRRDALTEWSRVIFTSPDGSFNVNPRQDFSKLIKK